MARAYVGTSGFAYKEWRPGFYPEKLAEKSFLGYYASQLGAVEIDYTFYRMPNAKTLDAWAEATPAEFRFALKASQKITHFERLQLPSTALEYLLSVVPRLGSRLGTLLYQLPPNFRCNPPRLEAFLANLPREMRATFEFRHDSWFCPEVYDLLRSRGIGLCINEGDEGITPIEVTAPFVYLRLRKSEYSDAEREAWQGRIREWVAFGVDVFAFIKHEDSQFCIPLALELTRSLAADGLLARADGVRPHSE